MTKVEYIKQNLDVPNEQLAKELTMMVNDEVEQAPQESTYFIQVVKEACTREDLHPDNHVIDVDQAEIKQLFHNPFVTMKDKIKRSQYSSPSSLRNQFKQYAEANDIVYGFKQTIENSDRFFTVTEVANRLDITPGTVREHISKGQLRARRSHKIWIIRRKDFEEAYR